MKRKRKGVLPAVHIESVIHTSRDERVLLDTDLGKIYGIPTFRLNEAVKRNRERFPEDFLFQLTREEHAALTSQLAMSKRGVAGGALFPTPLPNMVR